MTIIRAGSGLNPLILPTATSPAQTADGSAVWDSDDDVLTVGDGASRKTFGYVGASTPAAVGTAANGSGNEVARVNHVHALTYVTSLNLADELHNAPPSIEAADGARPDWWSVSANATLTEEDVAGESITEIVERCLKVVTTAGSAYGADVFTYANEPRLKSGRSVSLHFLVWSVAAAAARVRIQSSAGSLGVSSDTTAAAWTLLHVGPVTLDGTTVDVRLEVDTGTAYFIPCNEWGVAIQPRGLRYVTRTPEDWGSGVVVNADPAATWTTVDCTSVSHSLAAVLELNGLYYNDTAAGTELLVRRLGASNSHTAIIRADNALPAHSSGTGICQCDAGQNIEYIGSSTGSNVESIYIRVTGYWIWS